MNSQNTQSPAPATAVRKGNRGSKEQDKSKVKVSVAIKPEQFQTKKGIRALYEKTKALKIDEYSEINIESTMKKIVTVLKTWQFQFTPKYSFDYFLQRCQALGNHKLVTAYMSKVRRIHKGADQWQQTEPAVIEQNHPNQMREGNTNENLEHDLNMLGGHAPPQINRNQQDEDDEDLLALMYQTEKRGEDNHGDKMEEEVEEQYIPEGFEQVYASYND